MSKKESIIDLKKVMNDVIKLSKQNKMTGKGLFDKCWWQHNFNHSNMSQQCKNEYSNSSMRKQLLGFGKKNMKGGAFNALPINQIEPISNFLLHQIQNGRRLHHIFARFVIPNSATIHQNLLQAIQQFAQIRTRLNRLIAVLNVNYDLPNVYGRIQEVLNMMNDIEHEIAEPSIGYTNSEPESEPEFEGGAYPRMNVIRRRQLNEVLRVLDEPRLSANQITELINYLTPSSDEIHDEIRHFTREDLPIVEFIIKYLRKLSDNLFNNEHLNIIFNDRKYQLIDILEQKRQLIRNIEMF